MPSVATSTSRTNPCDSSKKSATAPTSPHMTKCPKCKATNGFCSRECECEADDWSVHKKSCSIKAVSAPTTPKAREQAFKSSESLGPKLASPEGRHNYAARRAAAAAAAPKPYSYSTSYAGPSVLSVKPKGGSPTTETPSPNPTNSPGWEMVSEEAWASNSEHKFSPTLNNSEKHRSRSKPTTQPPSPASSQIFLDMTDTKAWLSSLPDTVCYDAIIDAYRLRVEDEYILTGKVQVGSLYAHDFPLAHFIFFIELARRERILPDSWSPKRSVACQQIALDEDGDACILHAVDRGYILDKYKNSDPIVVDVLRLVADKVYGQTLFSSALRFFPGSPGGRGTSGWWA